MYLEISGYGPYWFPGIAREGSCLRFQSLITKWLGPQRLEILESDSHLVEIDLLHEGKAMPMLYYDSPSNYRILVSDSTARPNDQLYPFNLQQRLPTFEIPLKAEDEAIALNLKPLLDEIYDLSGYDLDIDYRQDPQPKWPTPELEWIDELLKSKDLR